MNDLAKLVCRAVQPKRTLRSERRNIVFHRERDYRRCLKQLDADGIKPVKAIDSIRCICCHADRSRSWKHLHMHPRVAFVERDRTVKAHGASAFKANFPNVKARIPWNINRVQAPKVWRAARLGYGVKVAILDTGIARHPDLRIAGGVNTITGKSFKDDNGHGTHVAGIAAATGRGKIYGTAPKVSLYAVKALNAEGIGYISDIVEGIDWCLSRGIKIINMSFGLNGESRLLKDAIRRANKQGAVIVASAGNSGKSYYPQIDAPARYPETIAVAATTRADRAAIFSSRGRGIDVSAPGFDILSTWLKGGYVRESGTSMSAPHVTGAVALLRAVKPNLCASAVRKTINKSALRIPGGVTSVGRGLLQIAEAVERKLN
ncbi:S8 family peptidase [Cohnella cholangitidis]|uniref:S8 family peptidase n=1 Tax=Cohnella cholangitidis TaxID=2598458 RepID=A0A7G5C522_9BACL|nr:S8 family peptidase [Cohnella cholangitidis]QMV44306.1 S8 family peptidase [Cohnella cholangitidis]